MAGMRGRDFGERVRALDKRIPASWIPAGACAKRNWALMERLRVVAG
jgi:hypothetical protein